MHETRELASFAANTRSEDLPPALVDRAQCYILDTVGVGLFGTTLPWAQMARTLGGSSHSAGLIEFVWERALTKP